MPARDGNAKLKAAKHTQTHTHTDTKNNPQIWYSLKKLKKAAALALFSWRESTCYSHHLSRHTSLLGDIQFAVSPFSICS